ncbi:DUF418 domain-containing protein [Gordonia shandongensis]|uniref:DUF418 domain-containing protein n=1 Tax=Gordonia shandongensis TaxID=376351 RepID=UPI0003F88709|nr:DUF418 domain-containing protein [Gordonia shandongensis]
MNPPFLFGYSFTLQMASAQRAGTDIRPRMLRRIVGLFAIGALHTVFLYGGDILMTYAVVCLALLLMRDVSDRTALRVAAGVYGTVVVSLVVSGLLLDRSAFLPSEAEAQANGAAATASLLGGWSDVIGHHVDGLGLLVVQSVSLQGPTAFALFLLGMVAGRRRLLSGIRGDERVLRRIQLVCFPIGLAGAVAYASTGGNGNTLAVAVSAATAPLLTAAYVATLLRLIHRSRPSALRSWFAPAGRMALTNYLAQSVVGLLLFSGIGLGWAGRFSPLVTIAVAVGVFVVQLGVSARWLRRHRYGPAEWLLRWITNGVRPPAGRLADPTRR